VSGYPTNGHLFWIFVDFHVHKDDDLDERISDPTLTEMPQEQADTQLYQVTTNIQERRCDPEPHSGAAPDAERNRGLSYHRLTDEQLQVHRTNLRVSDQEVNHPRPVGHQKNGDNGDDFCRGAPLNALALQQELREAWEQRGIVLGALDDTEARQRQSDRENWPGFTREDAETLTHALSKCDQSHQARFANIIVTRIMRQPLTQANRALTQPTKQEVEAMAKILGIRQPSDRGAKRLIEKNATWASLEAAARTHLLCSALARQQEQREQQQSDPSPDPPEEPLSSSTDNEPTADPSTIQTRLVPAVQKQGMPEEPAPPQLGAAPSAAPQPHRLDVEPHGQRLQPIFARFRHPRSSSGNGFVQAPPSSQPLPRPSTYDMAD